MDLKMSRVDEAVLPVAGQLKLKTRIGGMLLLHLVKRMRLQEIGLVL
jgi:hypothetical protein